MEKLLAFTTKTPAIVLFLKEKPLKIQFSIKTSQQNYFGSLQKINTSSLPLTYLSILKMNIEELFQEIQDHQFDCLTFMKVSQCKWSCIHKIVPIMTDLELRALTISFDSKIESLKQQGSCNQLLRRVSRAYKMFLDEKHMVQFTRRIPGKSISSQVKEFFKVKIPLAIVILYIVDDFYQNDKQRQSKSFWIALGILSVILLLDLLDIYFKWENRRNPVSYEARLREGGLWLAMKDFSRRFCEGFSTKASDAKEAVQHLWNRIRYPQQIELAEMADPASSLEQRFLQ